MARQPDLASIPTMKPACSSTLRFPIPSPRAVHSCFWGSTPAQDCIFKALVWGRCLYVHVGHCALVCQVNSTFTRAFCTAIFSNFTVPKAKTTVPNWKSQNDNHTVLLVSFICGEAGFLPLTMFGKFDHSCELSAEYPIKEKGAKVKYASRCSLKHSLLSFPSGAECRTSRWSFRTSFLFFPHWYKV